MNVAVDLWGMKLGERVCNISCKRRMNIDDVMDATHRTMEELGAVSEMSRLMPVTAFYVGAFIDTTLGTGKDPFDTRIVYCYNQLFYYESYVRKDIKDSYSYGKITANNFCRKGLLCYNYDPLYDYREGMQKVNHNHWSDGYYDVLNKILKHWTDLKAQFVKIEGDYWDLAGLEDMVITQETA